MAAVRELILQSIVASLAAVDGTEAGGVVRVFRNRRDEIATAEMPALIVIDGGHDAADDETVASVRYDMEVTIEGWVSAATDEAVGPRLSALYLEAVRAALSDRTYGGLAFDAMEAGLDVAVNRETGAPPMADFALQLRITYFTAPGDPGVPAPG